MIVGKTGSGKSVSWQTLQQVLSTMKKDGVAGYNLVKVYVTFLYLMQEI
jgi:ABC-type dipeptide/oligopeptide/nickel transport system ATPase component